MEGTTNSYVSKVSSPVGGASSSCQESGWTDYFEYFMTSEKGKTSDLSSCDGSEAVDGFSLVSDAASNVVAWNPSPSTKVQVPKGCKKLKRRTRLEDDSLEDTASSPVSSPKVCNMNNFDMKPKKKDDGSISQERGAASANREEIKGFRMNGMDFVERASECEELKKKGLCLVPMSLLADYLNN